MFCCGQRLNVVRLIFNSNGYYKRVEFALCQECGTAHTLIYSMNKEGKDKEKRFSGKAAIREFQKYKSRKNNTKQGTYGNQNIHYGDFKKTRKSDENGIPIYLQLQKNFNNQSRVLGRIKTVYYCL